MSGHDRYLIYRLLGRTVEVNVPQRFGGRRVKGIVQRVVRDIFEDSVELTVNGVCHAFREPAAIVTRGEDVCFLYGDVEKQEDNDESVFKEACAAAFTESFDAYLSRTSPDPVSSMVFRVGPKPERRRRALARA